MVRGEKESPGGLQPVGSVGGNRCACSLKYTTISTCFDLCFLLLIGILDLLLKLEIGAPPMGPLTQRYGKYQHYNLVSN